MNQPFTTIPLPRVALPEELPEELARIRQRSLEMSLSSATTYTYQDAIVDMVARTRDHPGPVLELGVYYGGLSVQLGHLLLGQGRQLVCLDISAKMLEIAKRHFQSLGMPMSHVTFMQGTVDDYYDLQQCASAVVIDAEHRYGAVRHDLCSVLAHNGDARAIMLHDYCLRVDYVKDPAYIKHYVHVARAIKDVCGTSSSLWPIGDLGKGQFIENAASYLEDNVYEGMVIFPECLDAAAFGRADAHMACFESTKTRRLLTYMAQNLPLLPKVLTATETMLSVQADILKTLAHMRKDNGNA